MRVNRLIASTAALGLAVAVLYSLRFFAPDFGSSPQPLASHRAFKNHTDETMNSFADNAEDAEISFIQPPEDLVFTPSLSKRPPKQRAIITALFRATDTHIPRPNDADWFFMNVYFHAFMFKHDSAVKLKPEDNTEFVVMVTNMVPQSYRNALMDFGARILEVPIVEIKGREKPGDKYQYLYTKLNLYRLEGIFKAVLFIDVDMNFFAKSPVHLFRYFHPTHSNEGNNSLLMPSLHHFEKLMVLAQDPSASKYGDQGLLNVYFGDNGPRPWLELPSAWNANHLEARTAFEVANGLGFHGKLWSECKLLGAPSAEKLWPLWQSRIVDLRRTQIARLEAQEAGPRAVTLVPAVPKNCSMWMDALVARAAVDMFLEVAFVSNDATHADLVASHRKCAAANAQASHFLLPVQTSGSGSNSIIVQQLRRVDSLFERYDIVWVLENVRMVDQPLLPLHLQIAEMKKGVTQITTFRDCANGTLTGSFAIHRDGGAPKLRKFLDEFGNKFDKMSDRDVWETLLKEFTKIGGKKSLLVLDPWDGWYQMHNETSCSTYLTSEVYGERA
ncbi:hypothetical protein HDU83_009917 [Entophlyctis luteolus]|nr:hypothetical protein HDU83_009917 [Entophlyctis luteolus]